MILILSQSRLESTTESVMDYLEAAGTKVVRLNGDDLLQGSLISFTLIDGELIFHYANESLTLDRVAAVWYRRWQLDDRIEVNALVPDSFRASLQIAQQCSLELKKLSGFLFSRFSNASWLSGPKSASPNKLEILTQAAKLGFDVPATLVTGCRSELTVFADRCGGHLVTKAIGESPSFSTEKGAMMVYTSDLGPVEIESLPEFFFPSLFQAKVIKEFDLRVFYLDGQCFSAAIFSQFDQRTKSDFRRYNYARPNRIVPVLLPPEVQKRVETLMRSLELETGSLDLVKTPENRYVFLEVNPIGQFGMISVPCNYYLDKRVADFLVRKVSRDRA